MSEAYSRILNRNFQFWWEEYGEGIFGVDIPFRHVIGRTLDNSIVRSGSKNPAWRQQVHSGSEATTSYSCSVTEIPDIYYTAYTRTHSTSQPLQWHWYSSGGRFVWDTGALSFPSATASQVTSARNRCIQRFLERCNSVRTSFEAGQDIGELKETIESIIHPMNSLKELTLGYISRAKKLRRGRRGPSLAKALADSYLEYRFGWRPLALDVADAVSSVHQRQMSDLIRVSASATTTDASSFGTLQRNVSNGALFVNYKSHVEYGVRYIAGVRTGQVGGYRPLAQELQLDLPHFVPTVWDLIPYSWIVDYFTNIGDWLQGLCFRFSDLPWGCVNTVTKSRIDLYGIDFAPAVGQTLETKSLSGGPFSLSKNSFTRAPMHPGDVVPELTFEVPLSSRPWENLGALLTSRLA